MNNAPNFLNSMNMGGGSATSGSKQARLLAGLRDELTKIQPILDKVVQATGKIAENLTKAKGAGSLGVAGATGGGGGGVSYTSLGFAVEDSGMSFGNFRKGLAIAAGATAQALDLEAFAENAIARQRFGFFSGQGAAGASMSFQGMMNRGIATDKMDAARAGMMATSMGLMPSLPGFQNVTAGAEMFSRLVPGAGLTGGMQATAALNQASSVNRLRMIGIQVRDPATGVMRSPESIANDVWNKINSQKTGTSPITKQDIAISLQSGNALDMMLNQYFGNDPVLRQGVVAALMQKASGGDFSKESLNQTGALPDLAVSTGERNASSYRALNAYTGAAETGMMAANKVIATAADTMAAASTIFAGAVTAFTFAMQLSGGAGGAFGTLGGGLAGLIGGGKGGGKGPGGFFANLANSAKQTGGKMAFPGAKAVVPGASAIFGGVQGFQQGQSGQDLDIMGLLGSTAVASLLGFLTGGIPGAVTAGAVTAGSMIVGHMAGSSLAGGEGDGDEESAGNPSTAASVNPLSNLSINAPWMKKRDYLIDGKPPANPYHTGVDFDASPGDPVYAVKDGTIIPTGYSAKGFGNYVSLRHSDGYGTVYAHLSKKLKNSGTVKAGELIGYAGNTGLSSGPHLHFEVRRDPNNQKTHVDPIAYLSGSASPSGATPHSAAGADSATSSLIGELSSGVQLMPGLTGAPSPKGEGDGGGGFASTTNYGGVTVNINVPKGTAINEQALAKEIKRVLTDQDMLKKAVTR